ncbi:MAG TPA: hypothetical protein VJV78_22605, partial [Polyangiales bacterium]|nr:hypothetical protein [Polyangiales bacterium]
QLAEAALGEARGIPRLEAEALSRRGQARLHTGAAVQACSDLQQSVALRAANEDASSPWLADARAAAAACGSPL